MRLAMTLAVLVTSTAVAHAGPRCAGDAFAIARAPGGYAPYIRLTAGERTGAFLLDYGSTSSALSRSGSEAASATHADTRFSLPTFASGRFALVRDGALRAPPGGQVGMVGTDFLSRLTADFVFREPTGGDVVLGSASCAADILRQRGMVGIAQSGHFASDLVRVRADRPNVPVLPLRLGGITVPAQVDSGYNDSVLPPSVDINEALFQQLQGAGVALRQVKSLRVTTCDGAELRDVYRAADLRAALVDAEGRTILPLDNLALVRKGPGGCGGIGSMEAPAAQLGASILWQLGEIVFDPKAEMVWVPAGR